MARVAAAQEAKRLRLEERERNPPEALRQGRAAVAWYEACRFRRQAHAATTRKEKKTLNEQRHARVVFALQAAPELFAVARPLPGKDVTLVCFISCRHARSREEHALHMPLKILARAGLAHLIDGGLPQDWKRRRRSDAA